MATQVQALVAIVAALALGSVLGVVGSARHVLRLGGDGRAAPPAAGVTIVDAAFPCTYRLISYTAPFLASTGADGYAIVVPTDRSCYWSASTTDTWLHLVGATDGLGTGVVRFTVASSVSGGLGVIRIATQFFHVPQSQLPACGYLPDTALSPTLAPMGAAGGFSVQGTTGCGWAVTADSWIRVLGGTAGTGHGAVSYVAAPNWSAIDRTGVVWVAGSEVHQGSWPHLVTQSGLHSGSGVPAARVAEDYDGDGRSDIGVFRPSTATWFWVGSRQQAAFGTQLGQAGDAPTPAPYEASTRAAAGVFRPATGQWIVQASGGSLKRLGPWGNVDDVPVPADYDGDGKADVAVFRPGWGEGSSAWFILPSATSTAVGVAWGRPGDVPMPADYDGDKRADIAVYRPSTSTWYILESATNTAVGIVWGQLDDLPVAADYDGDGKADPTVFRPVTGTWFQLRSSGGAHAVPWGAPGDLPIVGDYDGDGRADPAVYRAATHTWYLLQSTAGAVGYLWGTLEDLPL